MTKIHSGSVESEYRVTMYTQVKRYSLTVFNNCFVMFVCKYYVKQVIHSLTLDLLLHISTKQDMPKHTHTKPSCAAQSCTNKHLYYN